MLPNPGKEQLSDRLKREGVRREWGPRRIRISSSKTTRIRHNFGNVPKVIIIQPIMHEGVVSTTWWHYRAPDGTFVYPQSGADGFYFVYLARD